MQTGTIIDFYDDPMGSVLKTKVAHAQLPDYVRSAAFQTEEKLASLPDDAFALIMVDNGKAMRKFACVDKGNTALSTLYFMETKDKLPEEAQKIAAANLLGYCLAFGIDPPAQLEKIATKAEFWGAIKKHLPKRLSDSRDLTAATDATTKLVAGRHRIPGVKGLHEPEINSIVRRVNASNEGKLVQPTTGREERWVAATEKGSVYPRKGKEKTSDLTGSEIMPLQSNPNKADDADSQLNATIKKVAGIRGRKVDMALVDELYVDVTGKEPAPKFVKQAHSNYALHKYGQGRFPLDSYGDVLEANRWFEENGKTLHPTDRQEYCTKLAARADQLGISVTSTIRKYASTTFAPEMEVRAAVGTRMQFWQSDSPERDALQGMLDKYASAKPEAFCAELTKFDIDHGINHYWDDYVIDPVASTFGMTKQAEWTWTQGADSLTEEVLTRGVRDGKKIHEICTLYGKDLASEIVENPNTVFDSLPLDSKRIIARILNDTQ